MWTSDIWADLDLSVAEVARLVPIVPPGSTSCYHGLTVGWIAEGILRGVGRSLGDLVSKEIAESTRTPGLTHAQLATPRAHPRPKNPATQTG